MCANGYDNYYNDIIWLLTKYATNMLTIITNDILFIHPPLFLKKNSGALP